ncbi:hypothetical protein BGX27_010731 [Mortierella sp. AM989]|nr:hypothetical protein BGX27_010731 [Mortierella sp. AM989]
MSKLLVVFGVTGQQGSAVANYVINDPELSKQYKVRGVTRDPSKPNALALKQKGIDVVAGDMDDIESLKRAVEGAHTVFAYTTSIHDENLKKREIAQGKAMADAAVAQGAQYIIFSTLPHAAEISKYKFTKIGHFDAKADVEAYIRYLPIKSAFFSPCFFMQNFKSIMAPQPVGDGTYAIYNVVTPMTELPLIDIVRDGGKFVGAILAEPEKFEGSVMVAATKIYTFAEIAEIMSKATGKTVTYRQIPEIEYRKHLPPTAADDLIEMMLFYQSSGFSGPQTGEFVERAVRSARGKLTTFEEFLADEHYQLN